MIQNLKHSTAVQTNPPRPVEKADVPKSSAHRFPDELVKNVAARRLPELEPRRLGKCGGGDTVAERQQRGVENAQAMLDQYGGERLDADDLVEIRSGVGPGDWCGMFVGTALGFTDEAKLGVTSTYRALRFFTEEGSGRELFMLEGTDTQGAQWTGVGAMPTERFAPADLPIQPGDVVIFDDGFQGGTGHVAMVESYDPATGTLVCLEGNVDGRIVRREYDLNDPEVAAEIDGFGRPVESDFAG